MRLGHVNIAKHPLKRSFVFFLVPDFTMVAFATALEPLRIANRMLGYEAYRMAPGQRRRQAGAGLERRACARVDTSLDEERRKMAGPDRPVDGHRLQRHQRRAVPEQVDLRLAARGVQSRRRRRRPVHGRARAGRRRPAVQQALRHPLGEPAGLLPRPFRRPMSLPISSRSTRTSTPAPAAPPRST